MALYKGFSTKNVGINHTVRLTDADLIKQDLINHFNIRRGEKLMNPDYGTIIWDSIFEPFTEQLKNQIIEDVTKIAKSDPRLQVESIMVDSYDNGLILELRLVYANTNEIENLRLVFDKSASTLR
jgi:phage baseplate assembly protein W